MVQQPPGLVCILLVLAHVVAAPQAPYKPASAGDLVLEEVLYALCVRAISPSGLVLHETPLRHHHGEAVSSGRRRRLL